MWITKTIWVLYVAYIPLTGDGIVTGYMKPADNKAQCHQMEGKLLERAELGSSTHRLITECKKLKVYQRAH